MILPCIFSIEVLQEIFEGMLEVGIGSFDEGGLLGVEVLIGEVDALSVHF
jgi:hypothetical protein